MVKSNQGLLSLEPWSFGLVWSWKSWQIPKALWVRGIRWSLSNANYQVRSNVSDLCAQSALQISMQRCRKISVYISFLEFEGMTSIAYLCKSIREKMHVADCGRTWHMLECDAKWIMYHEVWGCTSLSKVPVATGTGYHRNRRLPTRGGATFLWYLVFFTSHFPFFTLCNEYIYNLRPSCLAHCVLTAWLQAALSALEKALEKAVQTLHSEVTSDAKPLAIWDYGTDAF